MVHEVPIAVRCYRCCKSRAVVQVLPAFVRGTCGGLSTVEAVEAMWWSRASDLTNGESGRQPRGAVAVAIVHPERQGYTSSIANRDERP